MPLHIFTWLLGIWRELWPFLVHAVLDLAACVGSTCRAGVPGSSRAQHKPGAAHGVLLARRQHCLLGPSTLSPCGGTEWSSCSPSASAAFQGILRKKVIKKKNQNCSRWRASCKIQTPKARLKALARLSGINSKMSALFLLDRFVTFPFLSLLYITCSSGIAYCGKNSYLQMLTGDLAAAERSCLKQPGVVPDFPLCLHSPQHGTGQGEWVSGCWGITPGFTATPGLAVISALAQRNCISQKCSHPLQGLSPTKSHKSCSVNMTLCSVRWWGAMISQGLAKP